MSLAQPGAVEEEAYLVYLKALALAVCLHQPLQGSLFLDLEVNDIPILQHSIQSLVAYALGQTTCACHSLHGKTRPCTDGRSVATTYRRSSNKYLEI